jgi:2-polyprenyl-3-methyl-5-hydroxy-6-metoxy-1,4-benzoquinol methylase
MEKKCDQVLLNLIDSTSSCPKYQTVSVHGRILRYGSELCWKTWEHINELNIDFKDKTVYDIGCFDGYFSFKMADYGARTVVGIDLSPSAVNIYNHICQAYQYDHCEAFCLDVMCCDFFKKKSDITVCLNMIHYIKMKDVTKYMSVLRYMFDNSTHLVLEINESERPDFDSIAHEKNFKLIKVITSHRNTMYGQRYVLHYSVDKN